MLSNKWFRSRDGAFQPGQPESANESPHTGPGNQRARCKKSISSLSSECSLADEGCKRHKSLSRQAANRRSVARQLPLPYCLQGPGNKNEIRNTGKKSQKVEVGVGTWSAVWRLRSQGRSFSKCFALGSWPCFHWSPRFAVVWDAETASHHESPCRWWPSPRRNRSDH